ncbi:MAG: hypothetical protein FJ385_05310 [Verrucomicrobia bacterium]|nr:hypothetical protein [Verrucomicrobiota bacterium]
MRQTHGFPTGRVVVAAWIGLWLPAEAWPSWLPWGKPKEEESAPAYREESPLPQGWPRPGPYGQVARKSYPAYRAAFTVDDQPNGGFWTLFRHIQRQGIPMTAPVEMELDSAGSSMPMERMAFLYQSTATGSLGKDGERVEVRDVPAAEALSYAWLGGRDRESIRRAREAIDAELKRGGLKARGYRLLGYNSPFVPRARQTHELQALLE